VYWANINCTALQLSAMRMSNHVNERFIKVPK
jgi:hypothetical protein